MIDIEEISPAWLSFTNNTQIAPIKNERHYLYMTELLESLLKKTGCNEDHELIDLLNLVSELVANYEQKNQDLPKSTGLDALKFLLEQNNLKQSDLPEIGSQGVISEILNGKRTLNLRQIKLLAKRFKVTTETFI